MTHEEIENLIGREAARRKREDLQHMYALSRADVSQMAHWRRHTLVYRVAIVIGLMIGTGVVTSQVVAQPLERHTYQGRESADYNYIVTEGDPEEIYDTLSLILK